MKLLLAAPLPIGLFLTRDAEKKSKEPKCFYYCTSRSWTLESDTQQTYVLYSEIKEFPDDKEQLKLRAHQWGDLVKSICKNKNGCTSDLNHYPTLEVAKEYMKRSKERYGDPKKFVITTVDFK